MNTTIDDLDWDFLIWISSKKADELWQTAQQFNSAERLALHRFLEAELAEANS